MLSKETNNSNGSGQVTFFKAYERSNVSCGSVFFSLFRQLSYFLFLDVVLGNDPPNPFLFTNSNCYFSFDSASSPGRKSWPAFLSIVNGLLNGTAGAITQTRSYLPADNTIWSKTICEDGYMLQSNCSQNGTNTFSDSFIAMINNNTAIEELRNCGYWTIGNTIATIFVFAAMLAIWAWAIMKIVNICNDTCQSGNYDAAANSEHNEEPRDERGISLIS